MFIAIYHCQKPCDITQARVADFKQKKIAELKILYICII
jgi:hypothetical protein